MRKECAECFCQELCHYILIKKGIVTTCSDFQYRVQQVVNKQIDYIIGHIINSPLTISDKKHMIKYLTKSKNGDNNESNL